MNLFSLILAVIENAFNKRGAVEDSEQAVEPISPPLFDNDVHKPTIEPEVIKPIVEEIKVEDPFIIPTPLVGPWKFTKPAGAPYQVINGIIIGNLHQGNPKLSPNFSANEFACACCKEYKIAVVILEALQEVRKRIGQTLYVAKTTLESPVNPGGSGYRCPRHNSRIRGASPVSLHLQGRAADVSCPTLPILQLRSHLEAIPIFANGGIGTYTSFIHVDNGPKRRWRG